MEEEIKKLQEQALKKIAEINDLKELQEVRIEFLGKKGKITEILKMMGSIEPGKRPQMGTAVNTAKNIISTEIEEKEIKLKDEEIQKKLESEKIDVTLPSSKN